MSYLDSTDARNAMLTMVKTALADVPDTERPEDVSVARDYLTTDSRDRQALIDLFVDRVADYKALVHRLPLEALPARIAEACALRGLKTLVVASDFPSEWIPQGLEVSLDQGLSNDQLDAIEGVITTSTIGIAQTGTIVLDSGPGQGRRAISLIPDYHLCIIQESQVVGSVPEAVAKLKGSASAPGRPITFISGPSATSDIELNRVEGVHGPRTLEVLVVDDGSSSTTNKQN